MRRSVLLAVLWALVATGSLRGVEVSFSRVDSTVSADAAANGAPENGMIADFFVTTDADILSVFEVGVFADGEIYNEPCQGLGCSLFQPSPTLPLCLTCTTLPDLSALVNVDSWVNTPGQTILLGPDWPGDGSFTLLGDLSNDGPQTDFHFARMVVPQGVTGRFSGRVAVAGSTGPVSFPFSFALGVPEPNTLSLIGLGGVLLPTSFRRNRERF